MTFQSLALLVISTMTITLSSANAGLNERGFRILLDKAVVKEFKALNAVSYSYKSTYSKVIPDMYLAYDKDGTVIAGAALRKYKTYKKVTSMVVVSKKDGAYVIAKADIPDYFLIKEGKKLLKVMKAVKSVTGRTVKDASGKAKKIDAVSGATRYQKRLYLNFNILAKTVLKEMEANPPWTKKPIE